MLVTMRKWLGMRSSPERPSPLGRAAPGAPSIADLLERLAAKAETVEPAGPILAWGRKAFGLSPEAERPWFTRAWWGFHACRMVRWWLTEGRIDEVLSLVRPFDLEPLDAALAKGKGALLATAHAGPNGVNRTLLTRMPHEFLMLATHRWPIHPKLRIIQVSNASERKLALATSLLHLRRNGVVVIAADGEWGEARKPYQFLHHAVKLSRGPAQLTRLAMAPTIWLDTLWEPSTRSIRVVLEPSGLEPEGDPEEWDDVWTAAYLARLGDIMRRHPENLGFMAGIWEPCGEEFRSLEAEARGVLLALEKNHG